MKKIIFILLMMTLNIHFANSQTVSYTFRYELFNTPACSPSFDNNWKSSHGTPCYGSVHSDGNYHTLLLMGNGLGSRSEGVFIPYNFLSSNKYTIKISSRYGNIGSTNIGLEVYAANGLSERKDTECEEGGIPLINDKQIISRQGTVHNNQEFKGEFLIKVIKNWTPNKNYTQFWMLSLTDILPNGKKGSVFVDWIEITDHGSTTPSDNEAPTIPINLRPTTIGQDFAIIKWDPSTDNVKVEGYEIFFNGTYYYISETVFLSGSLNPCSSYTFSIRAYDAAGNYSDAVSIPVKTTSDIPTYLALQAPITLFSNLYEVKASNSILLKPGFNVKALNSSEIFHAKIVDGRCIYTKSNPVQAGNNEHIEALASDRFDNKEQLIEQNPYLLPSLEKSEVSIFPNPTTGIINIKYSDFNGNEEVFVIDVLGKTLLKKSLTSELSTINLAHLVTGIYYIKIINSDNSSTFKIIKK